MLLLSTLLSLLFGGCKLFTTDQASPTTLVAVTPQPFVTITPQPTRDFLQVVDFVPVTATPPPYYRYANELGQVVILEYHKFGYPERRYQRTPENFRADLARLHQAGYYPVNFIDLIRGLPDVPPGKKPVVLTFDDSDISQFKLLADGSLDPDSAVGVLVEFSAQHAPDWPLRATFFVLGNDYANYKAIFGQPDLAKTKLQFLVESGMEIGSHTVTHRNLGTATADEIHQELALSKQILESLVTDYRVQTMAVPFGGFPFTLDFLKAGEWQGVEYTYYGNAAAWGGPAASPFDLAFEPYRVPRIEVTETSFNRWLAIFENNPEKYYTSDGDPARLTIPESGP